jgi:serine/threonine-protein kinase
MPPEQARGRWSEVDGRSDLWSIGATMYALLVGRPVHVAETMNEVLLAAMTLPARPIGEAFPGLPAAARQVVDRALAYERDDRWPDALGMQAAVRAALADPGLAGAATGAAYVAAPKRASPDAATVVAPARAPAVTTARAVTDVGLSTPPAPGSRGRATVVVVASLAFVAGGVWWVEGKPTLAEARARIAGVTFSGHAQAGSSETLDAPPPPSASAPPEPPASASASAAASPSASAPPNARAIPKDDDDAPPRYTNAHGRKPAAAPPKGGKKGKGKHLGAMPFGQGEQGTGNRRRATGNG